MLRHRQRGWEKQRVTQRWSISNKWRGQQDEKRVKDTGRKKQDTEGQWRECENWRDKKKNDLHILAGCIGHLGWEDVTEDRCEVIKALRWPHEERQPCFLLSYFFSTQETPSHPSSGLNHMRPHWNSWPHCQRSAAGLGSVEGYSQETDAGN